jgi:hypothetical protein
VFESMVMFGDIPSKSERLGNMGGNERSSDGLSDVVAGLRLRSSSELADLTDRGI